MRLRRHLVLLVVATLVPLVVFSVFLVTRYGQSRRAVMVRGLLETTRALTVAVDTHLEKSIGALSVLALSESLDTGDLEGFYRLCGRVRDGMADWVTVALVDPSGQLVFDLLAPYGARLSARPRLEAVQRAGATARPAVSAAGGGEALERWTVTAAVPVVRAGRVRYVLAAAIAPRSILEVLERQRIQREWFGIVLDRQATIVVRGPAPRPAIERTAVRLVAPSAPEGTFRGDGPAGGSVYWAFSRSPVTGWVTSLAVPATSVDIGLRPPLWAVVVTGAGCLLLAVALATGIGRHITRQVGMLTVTAGRLVRGEFVPPLPSTIAEVRRISRALLIAADERAARRVERQARAAQQAALGTLAREAFSRRDLDDLLAWVAELVAKTLNVRYVELLELLPGQELVLRAGVGWEAELLGALTVDGGPGSQAGFALRAETPVVVMDLAADERFVPAPHLREHGVVAGASAVVRAATEPWGILAVHTHLPRAFNDGELAFLQEVAAFLAVAIRHADLGKYLLEELG